MDASRTHKDLLVWRKSIELAQKVYAATGALPRQERFDLDQQMRRTVIAVATHVAEGWAHGRRSELVHRLQSARALLLEVETQTMIAIGQGYFEATSDLPDDIAEVGRLLNGLIRSSSAAAQIAHAKACAPDPTARTQGLATSRSRPPTSLAP